jgi:hypothetical protein
MTLRIMKRVDPQEKYIEGNRVISHVVTWAFAWYQLWFAMTSSNAADISRVLDIGTSAIPPGQS